MIGELLSSTVIGKVIDIVGGVLETAIDDPKKRVELQSQIHSQILANEQSIASAASRVIVAEATGHSWIQRNWRPLLMVTFMWVVVWNMMIAPILSAILGVSVIQLAHWDAVPNELWTLLTVGVGGYITTRSGEKMMASWAITKNSESA